MKPSILVGIGIAALIMLGGLLAPVFRAASDVTAEAALAKAELANRKLGRVDPQLQRLRDLAPPEALKDANTAAAADRLRTLLEAQQKEAPQETPALQLQRMQERAKAAGLEPVNLALPDPNASTIQRSVAEFQAALKENDELLLDALKDAAAARSEGASVVGAAQAEGMAQYAQAAGLLMQAEALRVQQRALQARFLSVGMNWKVTQGYADQYRGLDTSPILSGLKKDQDDLAARGSEAEGQREVLARQVAEREQALRGIDADMKKSRAELLALEEKGFKVGDDASFVAYRDAYLTLMSRLRGLEEQEQELRYGGTKGAELVGDDIDTAELRGGEEVIGLEEYQRRLARAEERCTRLQTANTTIENTIKFITTYGQSTKKESQRYTEELTKLEASGTALSAQVLKLASEAYAKERAALDAAKKAVDAFKTSQQAVDEWVRTAGEQRSTLDPKGQNRRLEQIVNDAYLPQFARAATAAAQVLAARIQAESVDGNETLVETMNLFAQLNPEAKFDRAPFQDALDTARSGAQKLLTEAAGTYEKLAKDSKTGMTAWVPQAALAGVYHLLARVEPGQAAAHLQKATEAIQQAIAKREQSPYLKTYVRFRDHLSGASAPAQPKEPGGSDAGG